VKLLGTASDGEFEMPAGLAKSGADAARRRQALERRSGRNEEGRLLPVQSGRRAKAKAKAKAALAEACGRRADKRADRLHKSSRKLAGSCVCLGAESTRAQKMTASASGAAEEPGSNVAQKTGLNRSVPSAGRAKLTAMPDCKLAGKGGRLVMADPKYTSRICPKCKRKDGEGRRSQSGSVCANPECGFEINADRNAALDIRDRALEALGLD
jgi:putative transposase